MLLSPSEDTKYPTAGHPVLLYFFAILSIFCIFAFSTCSQKNTLSINQNNLCNKYRLGQDIVIPLKGRYVGKYNGQLLIGQPEWYAAQSAWEAGRMTLAKFQEHTELNGLPDLSKVPAIFLIGK